MIHSRYVLACVAVMLSVSVLADTATTKPAATPKADALTHAVDPYDMPDQKGKFNKLSGNTGELNAKTFEADRKAGGNLIMPYEKWETAVLFDKNKNSTLDWFEFEAYREAMRKAVLAACDKNKDKQLTGDERTAALKLLTDGKLVIKPEPERPIAVPMFVPSGGPATSAPASDSDDTPSDREKMDLEWRDAYRKTMPEFVRNFYLRHFDANGDGTLDEKEWEAAEAFDAKQKNTVFSFMLSAVGFGDPEAFKKLSPVLDDVNKAFWKRADPDSGGDPAKIAPEKMEALYRKSRTGAIRYLLQFEKQALDANDGKPGEASRAALIEAFNADLNQRFLKAHADNKKLDPEARKKLLLDVFDDLLKEE